MGYSYTCDDPDDMVVVVALRAMAEGAPSPFRVVVEEVDTDAWTHTLREGGFDTVGEALQWCDDRLTGEAARSRPSVRQPPPSPGCRGEGPCLAPAGPFALSAQRDAGGET